GPTGVDAPPKEGRHSASTRRQIVLADLVEKPKAAVTWGVNGDICEACFADHVIPGFIEQVPPLSNLECTASRQWSYLSDWNPSQPCDELFMFTDGSFFPGSPFASWAVVIIARQGGHIGRVGMRAGLARGPVHGSSEVRPELSAFDGELEAALHALAVAAAIPCPLVHVGVDCAAAIDVIQGQVALKPQDDVAHAAVAVRALLMMQGKTVLVQKVLAHAGCALNGLADAAAKSVLKQGSAPTDDFSAFWAAISEGVVAKLWLVPSHPLTACTLPHLNDSGSWSQASCAVKRTTPLDRIFGTHPQVVPSQQVDLRLRILQYNALSLRGAGATDLIAQGLAKHRVDVAGLQETRLKTEGITTLDDFWVLHSPCTKQGHGGAQIWVRRSKHWDRQAFAILHKEPQVLVALGVFKGVRVLLVSAHALPACSPDADLQEWWGHYDTILHKSPANCIPIFMMDANATFAGGAEIADTHQCRPTCGNSSRLLELASRRGLCLSPQQTPTGEQLFSWTSPKGHRKLIDYVAWPHEWAAHGNVCPGVLLGDLHEDIDHQPVCLDLCASLMAPQQVARNSLDARMWQNPCAATTAAVAALACPPVPWIADSTTHVDCIHRISVDAANMRQGWLTGPICSYVYMPGALEHARIITCVFMIGNIAGVLQVPGHDNIGMPNGCERQCGKTRQRSPGRRYRAPALLPSLTGEPGGPVTKEDVADSFGKYFAIAERAEPLPVSELVQTSRSNGTAPCFDGDALPTLSRLASGFASLQKGRAPGLSGIPSEVFRSNPMLLAIHYFPVVCKLLLRDPSPVQWRGGLSVSVPKPGKPGDLHQGYRAIMLLEGDNKAVQKAVRPQLLEALPRLGTPDQMGGRPGFTLSLPAACVKAHLANLKRTKASGAVIFIDSAAAYYSIAKDFLALTWEQKQDEELLRARARAIFDDRGLQDDFISILRGSADDVSEALPPALQTFLQKQLDQTWYISRVDAAEAYVAKSGTAPGAPLADVMFSLIFGRLLSRMAGFLAESGLQATFASEKGPGYTPTWADDVSILLRTEAAVDVPGAVAQVIGFFTDELQQAGLRANHGAGKTEALLSLNGQGAKQVRRDVFCSECPQIPFSTARNAGQIRVAPAYEYLGSTVQADGFSLPDVKHRLKLARDMFRPVKN
ncbi:ggact.2, partial [Symbiodinium necroappetens]